MFLGKLALTAPHPFSRSNCDSSTCLRPLPGGDWACLSLPARPLLSPFCLIFNFRRKLWH